MQFDSISAFFAMGGYGFYVWLSYGVSALMIALLIFMSCQSHKKTKQQIAQRFRREIKLKEAAKQQAQQHAQSSVVLSEENHEPTS
jgi:heme exporter protein D